MHEAYLYVSMSTTVAMALCFVYLHWRTRERYVRYWLAGALLWVVRYAASLGALWAGTSPWPWVIPALAVARATAFYAGARIMVGGRPHPLFNSLAAASLVWTFASGRQILEAWPLVAPYLVFMSGLVLTGITVAGNEALPRAERTVTGGAFVAMGILQMAYPLTPVYDWVLPVGTSFAAGVQTAIALGVLLTYLRASVDQQRAVAEREGRALTRVLGDFVSICAHCHSIRDDDGEGEWVSPTRFVALRTEALVDASLCPDCADPAAA